MASVKEIDAILPQTQCGECGFAGCLPYAQALAVGKAPIDRCPPGGVATVQALGELLAVDPAHFLSAAQSNTRLPTLAQIREAECIGCTKCIQACPVDAIIGTAKHMHVIIETECTGCGLCVEPCPVDCIELHPLAEPNYNKDIARQKALARQQRQAQEAQERENQYRNKRQLAEKQTDAQAKQAYILQALARVQAKKNLQS